MKAIFLQRLTRLFVLLLFQVLVFNQVHVLGYITPLMMGYMIVCFHQGTSRSSILLWGFVTGLLFDIFSNTAGMASASCTLIAMLQPSLLTAFIPRDATEEFTPSLYTLGFWKYLLYVLILMLILHGAFYLLDAFTLANWQLTFLSIGGGAVLATFLIFFIELLVRSRK